MFLGLDKVGSFGEICLERQKDSYSVKSFRLFGLSVLKKRCLLRIPLLLTAILFHNYSLDFAYQEPSWTIFVFGSFFDKEITDFVPQLP